MTLKEELDTYVKETFADVWERRDGKKVPETADLSLKNEAVDLNAVVLYADLADSTLLVRNEKNCFAAEIYKNFLYVAARIIRSNHGEITAYDGDRIMAVFVDGNKNSNAAKAALQINWAVGQLIQPALKAQYPASDYVVKHKVGIDASKVMVARTGIRGSNDLVWVGNAANNAAKLSERSTACRSYISEAVFKVLLDWAKYGGADGKQLMWKDLGVGSEGFRVYGSTWRWSL